MSEVFNREEKLSKEFKSLSHGFGAASGYSIITDAIKTIDDCTFYKKVNYSL